MQVQRELRLPGQPEVVKRDNPSLHLCLTLSRITAPFLVSLIELLHSNAIQLPLGVVASGHHPSPEGLWPAAPLRSTAPCTVSFSLLCSCCWSAAPCASPKRAITGASQRLSQPPRSCSPW